jgi:hypothetical protein
MMQTRYFAALSERCDEIETLGVDRSDGVYLSLSLPSSDIVEEALSNGFVIYEADLDIGESDSREALLGLDRWLSPSDIRRHGTPSLAMTM